MKTIYVIATETQFGYEEDSTTPNFVTEVYYNFGAWTDRNSAQLKVLALNAENIPEDDSVSGEGEYFILELKVND